ncbi:Ig-like domain-containing protein [Vibrio parahaemolyticus]|nr:Ig-like domain-containing protein [Vibrio parahaemolyticus]
MIWNYTLRVTAPLFLVAATSLFSSNAVAGHSCNGPCHIPGGGGVTPPQKPTVTNSSASIKEDSTGTLRPGVDGKGQGITGRKINRNPSNGNAHWSGNTLIYKPKANWCGRDTFQYSVSTSAGWSNIGTGTVSVSCVVDKPWVGNTNGSTQEENGISLSPAMKLDGGSISNRHIKSSPNNGTARWSGNKIVYEPAYNFCGSDTFTYSIRTQGGESNVAKATVSVACVVDLPIIGDVSAGFNEDTTKTLSPSINTDGSAITKHIIKQHPRHGKATWNGNNLVYTPNRDWCGKDTFTYQIQTSAGLSNVATASLDVACVIDAPVVSDVYSQLDEDTKATLIPTINTDGAGITGRFVNDGPNHGSLIWSGNNLVYTPNTDYCGPDEFTFSVKTSAGTSNIASGKVDVTCVPDLPTIENVGGNLPEDSSTQLTPSMDTDGADVLEYIIVNQASNGNALWNGSRLEYSPNPDWCGLDTFTYQIRTEAGKSNVAKANVAVQCVQDAPTVTGESPIIVAVESSKEAVFIATDADGDSLTASLKMKDQTALPRWMSFFFENNKGNLTMAPGVEHVGNYELELQVKDSSNGMKLKSILVMVRDTRPVNLEAKHLKTFSQPHAFERPNGKPMNAFYFNGIRDSEGKMISGTLNLNVSLAADASIPVKVLDKLIAPGKTETVSYQVETPGVIDIKVIPTQPGKEGLANVQIKFEVQ